MLWHISQIQPDVNNIFFYWDGQRLEGDRLTQAIDSIWSTRHFNPERPIWFITNTEEAADWPNIRVTRWDDTIYSQMPNAQEWTTVYNAAHPRDRSDLFRLLLLHKFGGSYIDTDDIAIRPIPPTRQANIVSRSYDPHTCHYDGNTPEDCVPGWTRETTGFEHIPWFPRNDCWYNWRAEHELIQSIIREGSQQPELGINSIYTWGKTGKPSWQTLILQNCMAALANHGKTWQSALTLIYLPESHVATCSQWDRGDHGGELHAIWPQSPLPWGQQEFTLNQATQFIDRARAQWPMAAHMWLHDKGDRISSQWDPRAPKRNKQLMSTHIIQTIRQEIGQSQ